MFLGFVSFISVSCYSVSFSKPFSVQFYFLVSSIFSLGLIQNWPSYSLLPSYVFWLRILYFCFPVIRFFFSSPFYVKFLYSCRLFIFTWPYKIPCVTLYCLLYGFWLRILYFCFLFTIRFFLFKSFSVQLLFSRKLFIFTWPHIRLHKLLFTVLLCSLASYLLFCYLVI